MPFLGVRLGIPMLSGGGNLTPAQQPLRSAVSRALVGQGFVSGLSGTFVQGQSRMLMLLAAGDMTELRVVYGNWGGQGEAVGPGNLVVEAALECDGPLGVARFTWGGNNTVTIAPGHTAISDALLPAALGLTVFQAGSSFWFRTGCTAVSNAGFPFSNLLGVSGEGQWAGPAFTSQINATGAMTVPSGGSTVSGMLTPFAVLGRYIVAMPTLCDIGDSISAGVNDTAQSIFTGLLGGNGYVGRAAYTPSGGSYIYPTLKLGIGGDGATPGGYTQRATLFQYATHGLTGWGVNDVEGASAATVFANLKTAWGLMKAAGIQYIFQALVTPKTTSTDSWATEANQTYFDTNFQPGGTRDQLNVLINASVGSNNLTGVVNFLSVVQGIDSNKWVTPSATTDGLHPLGPIHALMAPFLTTALQSAGPQLPAQDTSWVPSGADYALNFKTGKAFNNNFRSFGFFPTLGGSAGTSRTSVGYGVTAAGSTGVPIQFGPNTARITPGRGLIMEPGATNLAASPFAPATQTIAVTNATQYTVSVTGTGSLVLSGAATGTVTAGSPITFTSSGTSLVATVSGTLLSMQVETGAVASTPISGTRSAEDVGWVNNSNPFANAAGTVVVTFEGVPPAANLPIFDAFGAGYFITNTASNVATTKTATLVAALGATANGHTVAGIAWDGTGRGIGGNGGTIVADANATGMSGQQVYIGGEGAGGGDSKLARYIQMITHYPIRLTAASTPTFQQATTP